MVENKETLGKKIQLLRQEKNISQKELAELIEKTTAEVAMWEADEATPSIADIVKLSSALGKTTDYLLVESSLPEEAEKEKAEEATTIIIGQKPETTFNKETVSKKKIVPIIIVLAILLASAGVAAYLFNRPFSKNTKAIENATSSVVKIYCFDYYGNESATGSGFIAFDDKTVVTNYHVMSDSYTCRISTEQDKTFDIESIIAYSKDFDIAILKLKEPTGLKVLELADSEQIKKGETVTAIGSPLGLKNTVSQGVLSGRLMETNMDVIQFTAAISHGSSGGALFNENGQVIGVTYASLVDGQSLNFAIPTECVKKIYNERSSEYEKDKIFYIENPAYKSLNDALEITIEQLKKDPKDYVGQLITINGYISSFNSIKSNRYVFFVSDKQSAISGDFESDKEECKKSNTAIIDVIVDDNTIIVGDQLSSGDKIIVVGKFGYSTYYDESGRQRDYVGEFEGKYRYYIIAESLIKE